MKKVITITITMFLLALAFSSSRAFSFSGGNGTESDPYQIANIDDLQELNDSVIFGSGTSWSINKYFILTQDITDIVTFHIGGNRNFAGHLNGNRHKITIEMYAAQGLFANTDRSAIIENLIVDGIISVSEPYVLGLGAIVGNNHGTIRNCINYASVFGGVGYCGGISGYNFSIIENCINYGSIESPFTHVGGIAAIFIGTNMDGRIDRCINVGNVKTGNLYWGVGGIVGMVSNSTPSGVKFTISNCINIGNIGNPEATNNGIGGIIGYIGFLDTLLISNCINAGYIQSNGGQQVGGILGNTMMMAYTAPYILISNCINTGVVEGNINVGAISGLIGSTLQLTITNCHYDKQFCIHKGVNGADVSGVSGHLTRNMVGRKLASLLGDNDWTYTEGATLIQSLYPQLKTLDHTDASKVGATPIFLYDGLKD